jgi:hypothetical protein
MFLELPVNHQILAGNLVLPPKQKAGWDGKGQWEIQGSGSLSEDKPHRYSQ